MAIDTKEEEEVKDHETAEDELLDLNLDLFGPAPEKKIKDDEVTTKICPRCWQSCTRVVDGEYFCSRCKCAIKYLKPRPYSQRNDI
jgi:hypothetical protein